MLFAFCRFQVHLLWCCVNNSYQDGVNIRPWSVRIFDLIFSPHCIFCLRRCWLIVFSLRFQSLRIIWSARTVVDTDNLEIVRCFSLLLARSRVKGKIQGDGRKFLHRFKSSFGSQILSQSLNEVHIYRVQPKSATKGDFFHIFLSLIVSSWCHG